MLPLGNPIACSRSSGVFTSIAYLPSEERAKTDSIGSERYSFNPARAASRATFF
jgi:hypothetical protein